MGAVLDYLEDRPDVDPNRVAAYGLSLGGYIVLRSVSYEGRIKACAVSTPLVDWHQTLLDAMPTVLGRAPRSLFNTVMKLGNLFSRTQLIAFEKFFEWQVGAEALRMPWTSSARGRWMSRGSPAPCCACWARVSNRRSRSRPTPATRRSGHPRRSVSSPSKKAPTPTPRRTTRGSPTRSSSTSSTRRSRGAR